ncbi:TetR/AcrR family transcriptional regulator [Mycolicibacterium porcinum]|uniref:TetR/AcrR family transcriptional regulator n=1 Tax=Mycolicibacterium porcinum TaxID=39693 RepID=UPI001646DD53|nr:TetR/AcrR family transcriptional regulator [Mycolicibacterium porcinum]
MTTSGGSARTGRRPNRRGESSRKHVLDVALKQLASGGPDAVSVKLIAKEANVTWGTIQYQFGDADGFWAATILHILDTAGPDVWAHPSAGSVEDRVAEIIDLLWNAYGSPYNAALSNLRAALAKDRTELERNYPCTASALDVLEDALIKQFREFFDGVTVDPRRARQVSALLPAALRGLHAERAFGPRIDIDDALGGLRAAITLYMTAAPASARQAATKRRSQA